MLARVVFVQFHIRRLDGELAPFRHGVAGIDDEVHQDLLDLSGIGLQPPQLLIKDGDEIDILSDETSEHLSQIVHDGIQVDHFRLQHLTPAERQKLSGQCAGLFTGLLDGVQFPANRIGFAHIRQQDLRISRDDGQQIVEVMRDAARKLSHDFHFLSLAQLLLTPSQRFLAAFSFPLLIGQ